MTNAYAGFMYISDVERTLTTFRCSAHKVHVASAGVDGLDMESSVPPLSASEARSLANRLLFLADEIDERVHSENKAAWDHENGHGVNI